MSPARGLVFTLPGWLAVLLNVAVWAVWSVVAGYAGHRRPIERFERDSRLTRLRAFERDGRWYERRLRVRRWKPRLPEAGALFPGGFSKRTVQSREPAFLARFVAETRRAEWTHWLAAAAFPVFALWNPWWAVAVMFGYAVAANAPCIVVQRYNRARLQRALARAADAQRPVTHSATAPAAGSRPSVAGNP